jgi:undecaprenyl-diphosphatase
MWRRPRVFVLVAAGVLTAEVAATGLKLLFARQRPYLVHDDPGPLMRTHLDLTLPSGHAATAFAGAVLLSFAVPRLAPLFLVLAGAIAASRVYVGVHYPSDVLLGAAVGAAVAIALRLLAGAPRRSARAQPRG